MLTELAGGFATLFQPLTFLYLVGGFLLGLFFGTIPGLTATLAIALLLPFTFGMEITSALVMVMGIYMAGIYSGSVTGITINIPGAPSGVITTIEGHPLMKKGQGAKALGLDAFSSTVGGAVGALLLMLIAPPMAELALLFQTADKFSLVLLAIITVTIVSPGSIWKSIVATTLGLMMATVGMDPMVPQGRFHFGSPYLIEGVGLLPAVIGLFAVCELLSQAERGSSQPQLGDATKQLSARRRDFMPTLKEIRDIGFMTYLKSSLIGTVIGVLPGGGASMASFIAYGEAKRVSKHPEEYGHGSHEGLAASEASNNAMCGGAIIPLLTLGIPGDAVTAIIFGVLLIHGLVPGPELIGAHFDIIAPMFAALFVASIFVFISVLLFGPYYLKIASLNRAILYTFIAMISMVGTYASAFSIFQMWVALLIGTFAYILRTQGYPVIPMLMGVILGPYLEEYLRRALIVGELNPAIFFTRPISLSLLILTGVFIYFLRIRRVAALKSEANEGN